MGRHRPSRFYTQFRVRSEWVEQIRAGVREELATQQAQAQRGAARATKRKAQLMDERQKLLQAHYAGAIPADLLGLEMKRLTRAMAEADAEVAQAKTTTTDLVAVLDAALAAAANCQQAYLSAADAVRRPINQGFFRKLFIGEDGSVEHAEMTEPFATLLTEGEITRTGTVIDTDDDVPAQHVVRAFQMARPMALSGTHDVAGRHDRATGTFWAAAGGDDVSIADGISRTTLSKIILAGRGLNKCYLVGATGFEPATARV